MSDYDDVQNHLTPTEEEQTFLILQGKCPHNKGWHYDGHGHNYETWSCSICNESRDY